MRQQKSYWMWNYGDYELFHSNKANSRRQEFGADFPVFWRMFDVERNVTFYNVFTAENDGYAKLSVKGIGFIVIDGKRYAANTLIPVKKGEHKAHITVTNFNGLPAAFIESDVLFSGGDWHTKDEYHRCVTAGFDVYYDSVDKSPEEFPFKYERIFPIEKINVNGGALFDFGKETFGYLYVNGVDKNDKFRVSYGESKEEALDYTDSIVYEDVEGKTEYKLRQRAFRYVFLTKAPDAEVYADYEYYPYEYKGSFRCNDEDVNKIWDICAYTLHITTREVHLEAIKRDRWLWGGDAYQAYKFNNYLFFDKDVVRRSTIALRGKEPFCEHINTITDYSFFWVIGLKEYLLNYGDVDFIKFIYPRAVSLMDFSSKRVNADGFITKVDSDWIFIDWSDIDKDGALSAEQILYIEANKTMAYLASVIGEDGAEYLKIADEMTEKTNRYFWSDEKGAYIDCYESGKNHVTRHANIFAVMYGIATESQKQAIIKNVLLNDEITQITTPYFEGYELDVFGMLGNFKYIEDKINSYWKGMLELGATTVWEEYDPKLSGAKHYEMYGKKYGKSLCHAWGAAPIYLLGKYFLGVEPTSDGFATFTVRPQLGGFEFIEGTVPILNGEVRVYLSKTRLSVVATKEGGTLVWQGKEYKLAKDEKFTLEF